MRYRLSLLAKRALVIGVASWVSVAFAQTNLGAVLDVGARQITTEEFKRDVVGKVIRGLATTAAGATTTTTSASGSLEIIYLGAGGIRGSAQAGTLGGAAGGGASFGVEGSWTTDERERVCTSLRMGAVVLAPRCQFWYVRDKTYFLSDSDSDRSARISSYTMQP